MRTFTNPLLGIAIACVLVVLCQRDSTRNMTNTPEPVKVTPTVNTSPAPAKVNAVAETKSGCTCVDCKCGPAVRLPVLNAAKPVAATAPQCRKNADGTWTCPKQRQPAAKAAAPCGPCGQASGPVRRTYQRQPIIRRRR